MFFAASEIRQVAAGADQPLRIAPEGLIELLCLYGMRSDPELTEFCGIQRLAAPGVYRLDPFRPRLQRHGDYWSPPRVRTFSRTERTALPEFTAKTLTRAISSVPGAHSFALSGGFDSGTLWILENRLAQQGRQPKAYALTFPGMAPDETAVIEALLQQTRTSASFLSTAGVLPSQLVDTYVAAIDRVLATPTFTNLDILARAIARDGGQGIISGLGAEVSLEETVVYAADLLRHGRLLTLFVDALRFRDYSGYEPESFFARVRSFARAALAPPGSLFRRQRPGEPPDWLQPHWHATYRAGKDSLRPRTTDAGYARREKLALLQGLGSTAYENYEQICQVHRLEAYHPFFHRSVLDLGLQLPPRMANRGRHTKQLLRDTARWAMGGKAPPWPERKVIFDAMVAEDHDLLLALGPARRWRLVHADLVSAKYVSAMVRRAEQRQPVCPMDSVLAIAERYWRRYE
jgi:hypothetical protein